MRENRRPVAPRKPVRLTDPLVKTANAGLLDELAIPDALRPGLFLRVRKSGKKTWVLRTTIDGKQHRITLGDARSMTVAEARTAPARLAHHDGRAGASTAAPEAPFFREWVRSYRCLVESRWKPSTLTHFDRVIAAHLIPMFGEKRIDTITHEDVANWFYTLSRRSPGGANRVLDVLRAMLNTARDQNALAKNTPDPTSGVKRNRPKSVGQVLTISQLRRLGETLDGLAHTYPVECALVRLILLTGCRPGEIFRLKWSTVGGDRLTLEDSKTGPRDVLLSEPARLLLKKYQREFAAGCRSSVYVFPHRTLPGRPRHSIATVWRKIRQKAGLPGSLRLHDLRHTFASHALVTMHGQYLVSRLLGHQAISTTQRYLHLNAEQHAAAADTVSLKVSTLLGLQSEIN